MQSACSRRSILAVLGAALPFGLGTRAAATATSYANLELKFRSLEDALRSATVGRREGNLLTVEVGDSEEVRSGLQGSHNSRPFAGFPAGHLRIIRTGSGPGPAFGGVRLYTTTLEIECTGGRALPSESRPLDFASLPAAPFIA